MAEMKNHVIVVNERDEWLGTMEKMQAHIAGALHRAISVFILNDKNEMLLQQRAANKYHSGGLWTNTCCSHPQPGESTMAAAHRRLMEEMGFDCKLEPLFTFRYKSDVDNGLIENEYDHIYTGRYNETITPNPDEAMGYKYVPLQEVNKWIQSEPEAFTVWFKIAMPEFVKHMFPHLQAA